MSAGLGDPEIHFRGLWFLPARRELRPQRGSRDAQQLAGHDLVPAGTSKHFVEEDPVDGGVDAVIDFRLVSFDEPPRT